jgi:hypothetical protein
LGWLAAAISGGDDGIAVVLWGRRLHLISPSLVK